MENHLKIYYEAFGYDLNQIDKVFVPSEISGVPYNDIHHIIGRGKNGEDRIENLMALTREEHIELGDKKFCMAMLFKIHRRHLQGLNIPHNPKWFEFYINKYEHYENLDE